MGLTLRYVWIGLQPDIQSIMGHIACCKDPYSFAFLSRGCGNAVWFSRTVLDWLGVYYCFYSELEQAAPMEETAETEEHPGVPERESPTKYELVWNVLFFRAWLETRTSCQETWICQAGWKYLKHEHRMNPAVWQMKIAAFDSAVSHSGLPVYSQRIF